MLNTVVGQRYGVVQYERGMEIVEIEGFLDERDGWVVVYGQHESPATRQRNTAIPVQRIVEVDSHMVVETAEKLDAEFIPESRVAT